MSSVAPSPSPPPPPPLPFGDDEDEEEKDAAVVKNEGGGEEGGEEEEWGRSSFSPIPSVLLPLQLPPCTRSRGTHDRGDGREEARALVVVTGYARR